MISAVKRIEHSPINRDDRYNHKFNQYYKNQEAKNNTPEEDAVSNIQSIRRNPKTGELIIRYENGAVEKYSSDDDNMPSIEENLRSQNYGTNFDFRA